MPISHEDRVAHGRLGAHIAHSRHDGLEITAAARAAADARFEHEVDPDNKLAPAERRRRAEHARRAFFLRIAIASVKSRRARADENPSNATNGGPNQATAAITDPSVAPDDSD